METWHLLSEWIVNVAGGLIVVFSAAGILFKEKWKQILAKSLSLDLEKIKKEHQKELEAYKVELIAETERHKAKAELKKSIAVKFAELKFDRLVELQNEIAETVPELKVMATLKRPNPQKDKEVCIENLERLAVKLRQVKFFIGDDWEILRVLQYELIQILKKHIGNGCEILDKDSEVVRGLTSKMEAAVELLNTRIADLASIE